MLRVKKNIIIFTIVSKKKRTRSIEACFGQTFKNINKLMLEDISRTTNSAEGWHRSLNSDVVISHPNLIRFIEAMKEEEESVRTQFIRLTSGLSFLIYAVIYKGGFG